MTFDLETIRDEEEKKHVSGDDRDRGDIKAQ